MKAMILAAGLGKRMRPLTDSLPKPLLPVGGKPLIVHHLIRLRDAGVKEVIINVSYLGGLIRETLGDGSQFDMAIHYSTEDQPLETAGAIHQALPALGEDPFLLVNGDVWSDFCFSGLLQKSLTQSLGHLVLVPNPEFKPVGDFSLVTRASFNDQVLTLPATEAPSYTYSGIGLLSPALVAQYPKRRACFALKEVFHWALSESQLTGELYRGRWEDVGTPQRLKALDQSLAS